MLTVVATDADDPTYGNSAHLVYSILQGQPYFSVEPKSGERVAVKCREHLVTPRPVGIKLLQTMTDFTHERLAAELSVTTFVLKVTRSRLLSESSFAASHIRCSQIAAD